MLLTTACSQRLAKTESTCNVGHLLMLMMLYNLPKTNVAGCPGASLACPAASLADSRPKMNETISEHFEHEKSEKKEIAKDQADWTTEMGKAEIADCSR